MCFGKLKNDLISNDFVNDVRFVGAQCAIEFNNSVTANEVQKLAHSQAKLLTYGGGRKGECVLLLPPINIDENTLQNALTSLLEIISQGLP